MDETDRTQEIARGLPGQGITSETRGGATPFAGDDGKPKPAISDDGTRKPSAGSGKGGDDEQPTGPDPLFWPVIVGFVPAGIAAIEADARAPSYALGSLWLYRLEVGLAVFVVCYILALIVRLAWQGRSFGRFELPGGGGAQPADPAQKLDKATEEVDEFQTATRERFKMADSSFADIESRLEALETDQRRLHALQDAEGRMEVLQARIEAVEQEKP